MNFATLPFLLIWKINHNHNIQSYICMNLTQNSGPLVARSPYIPCPALPGFLVPTTTRRKQIISLLTIGKASFSVLCPVRVFLSKNGAPVPGLIRNIMRWEDPKASTPSPSGSCSAPQTLVYKSKPCPGSHKQQVAF